MSAHEAPSTLGSPQQRGAFRRTLSIEWKLPLLTTAVLAAGLAAFLAFTYFTLAHRSETVVRDRFEHASQLVASQIADLIAQRKASFGIATGDPQIARVLQSNAEGASLGQADSARVTRILGRLIGGRDSLAVQLMDTRGRVVASAGRAFPRELPPVDPEMVAPSNVDDALDAVRVSPLV